MRRPTPTRHSLLKTASSAAGLLALAFAFQPLAQARDEATVARLEALHGHVLVARANAIASAEDHLRIPTDARVITTATGSVRIVYDNGCRIELHANQRYQLDTSAKCNGAKPVAYALGGA